MGHGYKLKANTNFGYELVHLKHLKLMVVFNGALGMNCHVSKCRYSFINDPKFRDTKCNNHLKIIKKKV